MADAEEETVRNLLDATVNGDIEDGLGCFAHGASYRVNAWNAPLVGIDTLRSEFERQQALWTNFRYQMITIASIGLTVCTERIDSVFMMGNDVSIHTCGVFDFDTEGKIENWREYFDSREIEAQLVG